MRSWIAWLLVLASGVAHANGRPPLTNGVMFRPNDLKTLYVRSTFGLLISPDNGCTMYWVCENSVGYGGTFDPIYAIASDGTIFATTYTGLQISHDNACSFTTNASLPANTYLTALDIGPSGEVWIGTSMSASNGIYASTDNGATFALRGTVSPTMSWQSIAVAPSDATRVYATGSAPATTSLPDGGPPPPVAHLETSTNDGSAWTDEPLTGVVYSPSSPILKIDAVDPNNENVLYVVSVGANGNGDVVYRSSDGGVTLTKVLATASTVSGIVVFDTTKVIVATQLAGSLLSTDSGMTYTALPTAPQLSCLGLSPDGTTLIGCGANWDPDYMAVARSTDGGMTWSEAWRFVNLYGPEVLCPAGTVEHDVCAVQQWPTLQQQFATTGPACGPLLNQTDVDAPPPPTVKHSGGCGAGSGAVPVLALAGVVALWLGRRRIRR
jgi:uncharacterized protein (TIGR03382 family)